MAEPSSAWKQFSSATALILFCDLQKGIVKASKTTTPKALSSSAGALLQLARLFSLPVIKSVVPEGTDAPHSISELGDEILSAPEMLRTTASLFADEATAEAIGAMHRKVLVVAGLMLEAVVLCTVLDALEAGYAVLVPIDACGSLNTRTEAAVVRQMEAAGAITTTVVSIGCALSPDFSTPKGKQMFQIVEGIHVG